MNPRLFIEQAMTELNKKISEVESAITLLTAKQAELTQLEADKVKLQQALDLFPVGE